MSDNVLLTVRLSPELREALKEAARREDRPESQIVRRAIAREIGWGPEGTSVQPVPSEASKIARPGSQNNERRDRADEVGWGVKHVWKDNATLGKVCVNCGLPKGPSTIGACEGGQ